MTRQLAWQQSLFLTVVLGFVFLAPPESGSGDEGAPQAVGALPAEWTKAFKWRSIGPANMSGRITAISVFEADPSTYWVATASGGLIKTTNNGVTFKHQFDKEATVSIGDVCVAPSNRNIVWVGTGEGNPRNSVSYGDGVYKSTDGGDTWQHMGLKSTFQIGRIAVHPKNPDIVYVGALGRPYGNNPERGLFKTTDGGKTWEKIFFLNDRTGVIDIAMHPNDPDTLLVAMWERRRDGFDSYHGPGIADGYDGYDPMMKWGEAAGIYKTTDGGKSFRKLEKGLPTSRIGRVGLDYFRKDPNTVYAIVDCEKIGMGTPPKKLAIGTGYMGFFGEDATPGAKLTNVIAGGPAAQAGLQVDDIVLALNKKEVKSYEELTDDLRALNAGDKVTLSIKRDDQKKDVEVTLGERPGGKGGGPGGGGFGPGGAKPGRPYHAFYGGQNPNIQNQQGPDGHEYGGVYKSTDGGESWTRVNSLNPRPMYFSVVRVDPQDSKYVYILGISQYRSKDGGKSFKGDAGKGVHADGHALWINPKDGRHMIIGTDGGTYVSYDRADNWDHLNHMALGQFYHVAVNNKRPYWVFGGLQDNGCWGGPTIGLRGSVGAINEDWVSIFGGDGYVCRCDPTDPDLIYFEMQDGGMGRRHLKTGEVTKIGPKGPAGGKGKAKGPSHPFNWNTPYILSNHNPKIFYCGGDVVFKSLDRGDNLKIISPKLSPSTRATATAIAESPKNPDVLWTGTDDGHLWLTRDGGQKWTDFFANPPEKAVGGDGVFPGLPGLRWVSTIETSRAVEGRAYVCFDAHRSDDDRPYIYVTDDFGKNWRNITNNLPPIGSTRCLREDFDNPDLLYCGTEFAIFASIDRGGSWTKINNNLPTVAIHEIAVHPTAGEIVAATHGRSLWILDVTALRAMKPAVVKEKAHLYKPNTTVRWILEPAHGKTLRRYTGENPPTTPQIYYSLDAGQKVSFKVQDIEGKTLSAWSATGKAGLNKTSWDMTRPADDAEKKEPAKKGGAGGGKKGGGGFGQARRLVAPGEFRLVMTVDGVDYATSLRIEGDPNAPPNRRFGEEEIPLPKVID